MKIVGSSVLHATPERIWAAITDPAVLAAVIPGCEELEPLRENHFGLTVTLGVASIKGSYSGQVQFVDLIAPISLTMMASGAGGPGTIDTSVAVRLTGNPDGTTTLDYDADATVGGVVGGVGQRVLGSVAKKTAGLFFSAIDDVLTGVKPVLLQPVSAVAGMADSFTATIPVPAATAPPAAARPDRGASLVAAVVAGAAAMLVGVLVGVRIGRSRQC